MSALGIPVDVEKSQISSDLNSFILLIFLMGVYTVVYFGTMYIYLAKNSSKSRLVTAAITTLFLCSIAGSGCQWYGTKWQFINNGDTRDSVFMSLYSAPQWLYLAFDTFSYVVFVIADGLLIWRCFYVWDRSYRIISVSLLLIVIEAALFLVQIALHAKYTQLISPSLSAIFNKLLAAAFFMSFSTTIVTTVLIAYRIYSVSKQEGLHSKRFNHIIDIVVQSGAVYALSQLAAAISGVVPGVNLENTQIAAFEVYIQSLNFAISGISATIMVARVALLSTDTTPPSTSVHLSGLQFHVRSTRQTDVPEGTDSTQSITNDNTSDPESQKNEGKVQ